MIESLEGRTLLADVGLVADINRNVLYPQDVWLGSLNGGLLYDTTPEAFGSLYIVSSAGTKTELLKETVERSAESRRPWAATRSSRSAAGRAAGTRGNCGRPTALSLGPSR